MAYFARSITVFACLAVVLTTGSQNSWSATIRVAEDGSGDYTELFDATRAAANGDTISIAPGTYDDIRDVELDGRTFTAIGLITASDIHVIGDSRDSVFIGPPGPPMPQPDALEYGIIAWFQASGVRVSNLTVQNVRRGIADTELALAVDNCRVTGAYYGMVNLGLGEGLIVNSAFESCHWGVIAYVRPGESRDVRVERTQMRDCDNALQLQGVNGWVLDCRFDRGGSGVTVYYGAHVLVERSGFIDTNVVGVRVGAGSDLWLNHCSFRGEIYCAVDVQDGALYGHHNRLSAGHDSLLTLASPSAVEFHQNHFLNAGGLSVEAGGRPTEPETISLAGNWWGTTDLVQIEAWILHRPDEPEDRGITIEYQPIAEEPIPTSEKSVGGFKSLFLRH